MKKPLHAFAYARKPMAVVAIAVAATLLTAGVCSAVSPGIYMIEEDWELVVNEPASESHSPQVTFFMSPTGSDSKYFQLQMNYAAEEGFSGGGFHVAAFQQDAMVDEARSVTRRALSSHNDRIRWTSAMAVIDGTFLFAVKNGLGDEWGSFGGPEYLVRMPSGWSFDLSAYDAQKSLDDVDIGFGANRVVSIKLVEVRVYYADGNSITIPVNRSP